MPPEMDKIPRAKRPRKCSSENHEIFSTLEPESKNSKIEKLFNAIKAQEGLFFKHCKLWLWRSLSRNGRMKERVFERKMKNSEEDNCYSLYAWMND